MMVFSSFYFSFPLLMPCGHSLPFFIFPFLFFFPCPFFLGMEEYNRAHHDYDLSRSHVGWFSAP